ncbi:unnamed protein product [Penicillium bialowiezense]
MSTWIAVSGEAVLNEVQRDYRSHQTRITPYPAGNLLHILRDYGLHQTQTTSYPSRDSSLRPTRPHTASFTLLNMAFTLTDELRLAFLDCLGEGCNESERLPPKKERDGCNNPTNWVDGQKAPKPALEKPGHTIMRGKAWWEVLKLWTATRTPMQRFLVFNMLRFQNSKMKDTTANPGFF